MLNVFAVLTGCLRIAKESIFTGLNNFKVYSITNADFDETFGFIDDEIRKMLRYYEMEDKYDEVRNIITERVMRLFGNEVKQDGESK